MIRRSRLLASLLLALAPGAGGQLVAALHPCPADQPAPPVMAQHQHHAGTGHHAAAPAPGHSHQGGGECSCVGLCCTPVMATAPQAPMGVIKQLAPLAVTTWPVIDAALRVAPLPERLPPKTAPPFA